jgi:hypothetical protein
MRGVDAVSPKTVPVELTLTDLPRFARIVKGYQNAIDAVRALHTPAEWIERLHDGQPVRVTLCTECTEAYPCSTVKAIEEALA